MMEERGAKSLDVSQTRETVIANYNAFFQSQGVAIPEKDIASGVSTLERVIAHQVDFALEAHNRGYLHRLHQITVVLLPRHDRPVQNVFRTIGDYERKNGKTVVEFVTEEHNGVTRYHHAPQTETQ